jgi:hypothetical protein
MRKIFQIIWKYSKWAGSFYYVGLNDMWLRILTWIKGENSIGRYVKIVTKTERDMYCSGASAGGFCYRVLIKLFLFKEYFSDDDYVEELTCLILEHEILHMVLRNRIGLKAYRKLDNVHKPHYLNGKWMMDFTIIDK